jgi:glycosyltransferase involved in cell wall biosynthesis
MKILIVSTYDIAGGAAKAAFRLHEALIKNGVELQMLVDQKHSDLSSVITPYKNNFEKFINEIGRFTRRTTNQLLLLKYKKNKTRKWGGFSPQKAGNLKLVKTINEINPDIVHLHWICRNFLSVEDIAKIKSSIVWSLHDIWAFTGGCHCVCDILPDVCCDEYVRNCGNCGLLGSGKTKDLSFNVLQSKKKNFEKIKNMTIIGLSRWMADCAKKSAVFADKNVVNLPNALDTKIFKPSSKESGRDFFKLDKNKKFILFGAAAATSRQYKGFVELLEALGKIKNKNAECVIFGANEPKNPVRLNLKVNYTGNLNNDTDLVALYNACDVVVSPSKRDNLSNVIMEALSCGVPVVCFDIGGNGDMVEHKKNGYLAKPFDTSDLAAGIDWVLNNENYDELSKNSREKVVREFDYDVVAKKYINLYENIVKNKTEA